MTTVPAMSPDYLAVGDTVEQSPVGAGTITGITQAGYPQVNNVAVACLVRTDGVIFDPHGHYKKEPPCPAPSQTT